MAFRFADYFSVYSATYICASRISQVEQSSQSLLVPDSQGIRTVENVSYHLSEVLALTHPTSVACAHSWRAELSEKANYIDLSTVRGWLKTVEKWVAQDSRVFSNLIEVYKLLTGLPSPLETSPDEPAESSQSQR